MSIEIIMTILGLVIQYGIPAVTSAIQALGKSDITLADIEDLKKLCKPPEEY